MAYTLTVDNKYGCCTITDNNNHKTINKVERSADKGKQYEILWDKSKMTGISVESLSEFKDYCCDIGVQYQYRVNDVELKNSKEEIIIVEFDYEDIILVDNSASGGVQLIRFNPSLSSLKRNQAESITQTLGGKYPVIRRNGDMDYYTFTLGGLISTLALKDQYEDEAKRILEERKFRKEFVDGLCNGKVKLFKAGPEGLMLVRITGVSLTPETKLGRDIYSFSATVTEVANATIENLRKYNIYSPADTYYTVSIEASSEEAYFVVKG